MNTDRSESEAHKINPGIPQTLKGRDHQDVSSNLYLFVRVRHSLFLLVDKHDIQQKIIIIASIFLREYTNC